MDQKEIDRIFYRDGFRLAHHHLEKDISTSNLKVAIGELYQAVDDLLEAFLQRSAMEGKSSDCIQGCAWCCHQEVFAVTHEFLYLNEYVNQHLSGKARTSILERAREKVGLTMNKTVEEQLKIRAVCPFLESDTCLAYEARPMACRIYLSSSVRSCKAEHDHPHNQQHHPDLFEFPLKTGRMLNEGFVACLKQLGLQVAELPIEQGYSSLVTLGQTMEDWVSSRPKHLK
jgi:Fe-S-cluster containining protein